MRRAGVRVALGVGVLAATLGPPRDAAAVPFEQRSGTARALYTGLAVVANVVPVVSTLYAPRCLPGYVLCKATFAGMSLIAATGQLALSGGGDLNQTRGILHRGFAGDWYLTGRHTSRDVAPDVLPEPPPPPSEGKWEPPPL
jgi:hypothetical protein